MSWSTIGLEFSAHPNVWVGDDTSDGVGNATGRVWFIQAGQPPLQ